MKIARLLTLLLGIAVAPPAGWAADAVDAAKFPFFPSLLNSATGGPISPDAFFPPDRCKTCHAQIFNQWRGSMHSEARRDPVFEALWRMAADKAGAKTSELCTGCHAGLAVLARDIKRAPDGGFILPPPADEGVHCHFCHSVVGTSMRDTPSGLPQNASLILDPGMIMRGPFADAKPMWHEAAYSELHTRAEFCGNCHNVFHPLNGFHIENTYTEWKFSAYAQAGIVCQDCHMMPVEKGRETARTMTKPKNPGKASPMGPERENIFTHEFVGGNFTVTALLGHETHAAMAAERLKSAAEVALFLPEAAASGDLVRATVRVTNVGAGHNLPTSLTEVRQMWLDITAKDADGKVLYQSGKIDAKGDLAEGSKLFGAEAVDVAGHHTVLPWEIVRFNRNHTIPPKGYEDVEYSFVVPSGARGPVSFEATLRYRSYPQAVANLLLGDKAPVLPVVDMAGASGSIPVK